MAISDLRSRRFDVFIFSILLFLSSSNLCAAAGPDPRDSSKALVSIQSVSVAGFTGNKTEFLQGASALFFQESPAPRLIKYLRSGGGVIIDRRGIIVTNAHLVQNSAGISVRFFNNVRLEARVIHVIPESDIAFLSVKPSFPLSCVPLANSDKLVPGARIYCIGHTLNHRGAIFGGEVSRTMKESFSGTLRTIFLQIKFGFHLYGGDSGSPILDRKGHLLGLVSGGRRSGDLATLAIASNVIQNAYGNIPKY